MEILGIGMQELVFIVIIALIVLGPKDMQKAGKTIGRWLNQVVTSEGWKAFQQTSREIQNLPRTLMREANMDLQEMQKDIDKAMDLRPDRSAVASPLNPSPSTALNTNPSLPPLQEAENSIQPPAINPDTPAAVPSAEDGAGSANPKHD